AAARQELFPRTGAGWTRTLASYALACSLLVALLLLRGSGEKVPAISRNSSETDIANAVGFTVVGGRIEVLNDGTTFEEPLAMGTCFAVSPEGHLLTNRHVVEIAWNLQSTREGWERRQAFRRELHATFEPRVWVFFGKERYEAEILHLSPRYDLAVLK